jgi:hypothetical protein
LGEIEVEEARQVGAILVGHQIWQRLGLEEILAGAASIDRNKMDSLRRNLARLRLDICDDVKLMPGEE